MKKFSVVSFKKDNTVEAVPSSWITDDKLSCHWPKKYPKNFRSIVQSFDSTPGADWILYEVEVVKGYETFERASKKAESYRYKSDAETSDNERLATSKSHPAASQEAVQPPEGCLHLGIASENNFSHLSVSHNFMPTPTLVSVQPVTPLPSSSHVSVATSGGTPLGNAHEAEAYFTTSSDLDLASKTDLQELERKLTDFQAVTLEKLAELQQGIAGVSTLLSAVLASQNATIPPNPSEVFQLVPVKTVEGFRKLEAELAKQTSYNELVSMFMKIGGPTHTQNVYNILKSTFAKSVVSQFRLTDTTGKVALKETVLAKAIRDAVHRSNSFGSLPENNKLNADIGRWFRNQGYTQNESNLPPNPKKHKAAQNTTVSRSSNEPSSEEDN